MQLVIPDSALFIFYKIVAKNHIFFVVRTIRLGAEILQFQINPV